MTPRRSRRCRRSSRPATRTLRIVLVQFCISYLYLWGAPPLHQPLLHALHNCSLQRVSLWQLPHSTTCLTTLWDQCWFVYMESRAVTHKACQPDVAYGLEHSWTLYLASRASAGLESLRIYAQLREQTGGLPLRAALLPHKQRFQQSADWKLE